MRQKFLISENTTFHIQNARVTLNLCPIQNPPRTQKPNRFSAFSHYFTQKRSQLSTHRIAQGPRFVSPNFERIRTRKRFETSDLGNTMERIAIEWKPFRRDSMERIRFDGEPTFPIDGFAFRPMKVLFCSFG